MDAMSSIEIIILAAGESKRLGKPKQLLEFHGQTLISRTIETALRVNSNNVSVVLGANAEKIKKEIENFPVKICVNENWQNGMASSLKSGLENLDAEIDAVIIMLGDQPLIEARHIKSLIDKFEQTRNPIIAAIYKNTNGVPALFTKKFFPELLQLEGDTGAKKLIQKFIDLVESVEMPEAAIDVDTPEDFQKLQELE